MERVKTGIPGLDEMLNGGIPLRRHVAVFGGPGTGKTSLSFEFVYKGAIQGETGVYITLEESPESIIENMKAQFKKFNDIDSLIKSKKLFVVEPDEFTVDSVAETLEDKIANHNAKRVAIDSSTIIRAMFPTESEYRRTIVEFFNLLKTLDCTTFIIAEAETGEREKIRFEIEHYVSDGIINLYSMDRGGSRVRALEIFKMRGTDHSRELVPFKVEEEGIKVFTGEKVF